MQLLKTAKALEELQPGRRSLSQRERSVLLMADRHGEEQLLAIFGAGTPALVQQLIDSGHLQRLSAGPAPADAPTQDLAPESVQSSVSPGTLSLAGTRMYLFDQCERMFAKRHEDKAQALRHLLREARDLQALQAAALAMLDAVQQHAGDARADMLRERLLHLLPQEAAQSI